MRAFTSHVVAFALGCVFALLLLVVGAIVFLRSLPERVPTFKIKGKAGKRRKLPPGSAKASPAYPFRAAQGGNGGDPRAQQLHAGPYDRIADDAAGRPRPAVSTMQGAYDPQLTKVGWMRIATRPLTTDELYMDGFGNPGEWFLDGLAVRPTSADTLPGESLSSLPNAVKRKQNIVANIASMSNTAVSIVEASFQTTSYLLSRFMGETPPLPAIAVASTTADNSYNSRPPWRNVFAVLKHKTLFVYSSDERLECLDIILLTEFKIELYPDHLRDSELYLRETPIRLKLKGSSAKEESVSGLYLYMASGSDKEDWLFMIRRASHLPPHADTGALSLHFQESEPMRHFTDAMVKLKNTVEGLEGAEGHATAWLNALVGRAFVGLHANPQIKNWVIEKLSRRYTRARGTSILGDIVIQDLFVGDSIPILSNPKLLGFSSEGDVNVEVDIDYTGGVRVEAATVATISVSAFEPYVKPLEIPLVVAIKVKRFSAKVLIKIKPYCESSRVWVGFYREPGLKLELDVEPIISNKLIRLQVVNQIIERRIKEALEELVVLPNMDDFSFWPSDGKGGIFWESDEESDENEEEDYEDAEDGYGEDESIMFHDEAPTSESWPALDEADSLPKKLQPKRTSVFLERVEENYEAMEEEEHLDADTFYRRLQQKYMEEALRAQQTEAIWIAETAVFSGDESEVEDESSEALNTLGSGIEEPCTSLSSSSDSPRRSIIANIDDDLSDSSEIDRVELTARKRLKIVTVPTSSEHNYSLHARPQNDLGPDTESSGTTPTSSSDPGEGLKILSSAIAKPKTPTMAVFEYLGETAEYAGRKSREYGLDEMARSLSETATLYGTSLKQRTAVLSDRTLAYFGYTRVKENILEYPDVADGNAFAGSSWPTTIDNGIIPDESVPMFRSKSYRSRPPSVVAEEVSETPTLTSASTRTPILAPRSRPQTPEEPPQSSPQRSIKPRPSSILGMLGVNITTAAPEQKASRKQKRRALSLLDPFPQLDGSETPPNQPVIKTNLSRDSRSRPIARRTSGTLSKGGLTRRSLDDLRPSPKSWSQRTSFDLSGNHRRSQTLASDLSLNRPTSSSSALWGGISDDDDNDGLYDGEYDRERSDEVPFGKSEDVIASTSSRTINRRRGGASIASSSSEDFDDKARRRGGVEFKGIGELGADGLGESPILRKKWSSVATARPETRKDPREEIAEEESPLHFILNEGQMRR
ncbi:hypothetical protein HDU67_001648 [Dinochytrium kinnereticum]|nr:hypothetical protein HDU67_001648 [Dinochytrium kinnereticum]